MTYLPTFLTQNGDPLWIAGLSLTLFSAAGIPASHLGGVLNDRIGPKKIYFYSAISTVILNFGFLYMRGWASLVFIIFIGFTNFIVYPLPMAFAQTAFPQMRSFANGIYVGMAFFLRSISLLVIGWLSDIFGMRVLYIFSALIFLLSVPIILKLQEDTGSISGE